MVKWTIFIFLALSLKIPETKGDRTIHERIAAKIVGYPVKMISKEPLIYAMELPNINPQTTQSLLIAPQKRTPIRQKRHLVSLETANIQIPKAARQKRCRAIERHLQMERNLMNGGDVNFEQSVTQKNHITTRSIPPNVEQANSAAEPFSQPNLQISQPAATAHFAPAPATANFDLPASYTTSQSRFPPFKDYNTLKQYLELTQEQHGETNTNAQQKIEGKLIGTKGTIIIPNLSHTGTILEPKKIEPVLEESISPFYNYANSQTNPWVSYDSHDNNVKQTRDMPQEDDNIITDSPYANNPKVNYLFGPPRRYQFPETQRIFPAGEVQLPETLKTPPVVETHIPVIQRLPTKETKFPETLEILPAREPYLPDTQRLHTTETHLPETLVIIPPKETHLPETQRLPTQETHLPETKQIRPAKETHSQEKQQLPTKAANFPETMEIFSAKETNLPEKLETPPAKETHFQETQQLPTKEVNFPDPLEIFPAQEIHSPEKQPLLTLIAKTNPKTQQTIPVSETQFPDTQGILPVDETHVPETGQIQKVRETHFPETQRVIPPIEISASNITNIYNDVDLFDAANTPNNAISKNDYKHSQAFKMPTFSEQAASQKHKEELLIQRASNAKLDVNPTDIATVHNLCALAHQKARPSPNGTDGSLQDNSKYPSTQIIEPIKINILDPVTKFDDEKSIGENRTKNIKLELESMPKKGKHIDDALNPEPDITSEANSSHIVNSTRVQDNAKSIIVSDNSNTRSDQNICANVPVTNFENKGIIFEKIYPKTGNIDDQPCRSIKPKDKLFPQKDPIILHPPQHASKSLRGGNTIPTILYYPLLNDLEDLPLDAEEKNEEDSSFIAENCLDRKSPKEVINYPRMDNVEDTNGQPQLGLIEPTTIKHELQKEEKSPQQIKVYDILQGKHNPILSKTMDEKLAAMSHTPNEHAPLLAECVNNPKPFSDNTPREFSTTTPNPLPKIISSKNETFSNSKRNSTLGIQQEHPELVLKTNLSERVIKNTTEDLKNSKNGHSQEQRKKETQEKHSILIPESETLQKLGSTNNTLNKTIQAKILDTPSISTSDKKQINQTDKSSQPLKVYDPPKRLLLTRLMAQKSEVTGNITENNVQGTVTTDKPQVQRKQDKSPDSVSSKEPVLSNSQEEEISKIAEETAEEIMKLQKLYLENINTNFPQHEYGFFNAPHEKRQENDTEPYHVIVEEASKERKINTDHLRTGVIKNWKTKDPTKSSAGNVPDVYYPIRFLKERNIAGDPSYQVIAEASDQNKQTTQKPEYSILEMTESLLNKIQATKNLVPLHNQNTTTYPTIIKQEYERDQPTENESLKNLKMVYGETDLPEQQQQQVILPDTKKITPPIIYSSSNATQTVNLKNVTTLTGLKNNSHINSPEHETQGCVCSKLEHHSSEDKPSCNPENRRKIIIPLEENYPKKRIIIVDPNHWHDNPVQVLDLPNTEKNQHSKKSIPPAVMPQDPYYDDGLAESAPETESEQENEEYRSSNTNENYQDSTSSGKIFPLSSDYYIPFLNQNRESEEENLRGRQHHPNNLPQPASGNIKENATNSVKEKRIEYSNTVQKNNLKNTATGNLMKIEYPGLHKSAQLKELWEHRKRKIAENIAKTRKQFYINLEKAKIGKSPLYSSQQGTEGQAAKVELKIDNKLEDPVDGREMTTPQPIAVYPTRNLKDKHWQEAEEAEVETFPTGSVHIQNMYQPLIDATGPLNHTSSLTSIHVSQPAQSSPLQEKAHGYFQKLSQLPNHHSNVAPDVSSQTRTNDFSDRTEKRSCSCHSLVTSNILEKNQGSLGCACRKDRDKSDTTDHHVDNFIGESCECTEDGSNDLITRIAAQREKFRHDMGKTLSEEKEPLFIKARHKKSDNYMVSFDQNGLDSHEGVVHEEGATCGCSSPILRDENVGLVSKETHNLQNTKTHKNCACGTNIGGASSCHSDEDTLQATATARQSDDISKYDILHNMLHWLKYYGPK